MEARVALAMFKSYRTSEATETTSEATETTSEAAEADVRR